MLSKRLELNLAIKDLFEPIPTRGCLIAGVRTHAGGHTWNKTFCRNQRLYDRFDAGVRDVLKADRAVQNKGAIMSKRSKTSAIIGALAIILLGLGIFLYVRSFDAAPTPSVQGHEKKNEQPAGPADPWALPGNKEE